MPIFDAQPRSWEAYLAAIGASGVLMASASVMFVILVGVVTFKTWPHAGNLLGDAGEDVALQTTATPAPQAGLAVDAEPGQAPRRRCGTGFPRTGRRSRRRQRRHR
jgi:hypothetical protein